MTWNVYTDREMPKRRKGDRVIHSNYEVIDAGNGKLIKAWKKGVFFEDKAIQQLKNTAQLPFIHKWLAAMPDTHWGMGATVGTVLPTIGAVVPAAVGVDIGCGMYAAQIGLKKEDLGDLKFLRGMIERAVPCGRTNNGGPGDRGAWHDIPSDVQAVWNNVFKDEYEKVLFNHEGARSKNNVNHLGTLGTGNHFIELSEDENGQVWIVLHSGSRGLGNRIGQYFTNLAKGFMKQWFIELPDPDLAYLPQGTLEFKAYKDAVTLAQDFAWHNRVLMMTHIKDAIGELGVHTSSEMEVHCHHNYISWEYHFGKQCIITRKGAVRAHEGDLGIIPGSMGARTYIVRGLGNPDSFHTCSHGAGRMMSRTQALKQFTVEDHIKATEGVECIKDRTVLDETPGAYKDIETVMAAQNDLVEPVHKLKQFLCVKGASD